jgi:hypothetical protein
MTTIGHVFIPLNREHDGTVPTDDDQARFESLPVSPARANYCCLPAQTSMLLCAA